MIFHLQHTTTTQDDEGCKLQLTYFLLEEEVWDGTHYGFEVQMTRMGISEKVILLDITPDLARAEWLLALLARNFVTPFALQEVLEELL